ncbi:AAA family ATPase [Psychrobacillus sp.]|uniref:ATP-dependent nuclease n=1 Tax=Psychrobacillus sp. TaxID=1871623 RepID=UPI0028BE47D9|nr:AAA family ATPase [Psychrobacillus sp.]
MKLLNMRLLNYKSIEDSGVIDLSNGINIFSGKNNSGKTALIESLYYIANMEVKDLLPSFSNKTNLYLEISIDEIDINLLNKGTAPEYFIGDAKKLKINISFINDTMSDSCINTVDVLYEDNYVPLYKNRSNEKEGRAGYIFNNKTGGTTNFGGRPQAIDNFMSLLKDRLVFINGARYVPKEDPANVHTNLSIDGTNLNAFLFTLHNNNEQAFDEIIDMFKIIFNDITSISTPIEGGNTYISLYFEGNLQPIPLSNCGSGFTHVLIILCVLFTKESRIILYDEPHVFLHPSAEKAIYDLISAKKNNQYLLTTHSPLLINYPFSKNIYLVQKKMGKSIYTKLDNIQEILSDIGLNNSDFALADRVIFVEGETEEAVIPLILEHFGFKQIGYNYRILKMNGTGNEFSKKSAMTRNKEKLDLVLGGINTSPIPYRILIDSDEKPEGKILEIKEKYEDNVVILERREIENYFLDCPKELSLIINNEAGSDTNHEDIEHFINQTFLDTDNKKIFPREETNPFKNSVGSEVLERLFSNYDLTYNKIIHGTQLTKLILEEQPVKLKFLIDELGDFI